jgi:hypothetical protein
LKLWPFADQFARRDTYLRLDRRCYLAGCHVGRRRRSRGQYRTSRRFRGNLQMFRHRRPDLRQIVGLTIDPLG